MYSISVLGHCHPPITMKTMMTSLNGKWEREHYQMTQILGRGSLGKVTQAGALYSCGEFVTETAVNLKLCYLHGIE
jgi:hypothetical protein